MAEESLTLLQGIGVFREDVFAIYREKKQKYRNKYFIGAKEKV